MQVDLPNCPIKLLVQVDLPNCPIKLLVQVLIYKFCPVKLLSLFISPILTLFILFNECKFADHVFAAHVFVAQLPS